VFSAPIAAHTKIEELLGEVFSMRSVLSCYKEDKSRLLLAVKQSLASKDVNTKAEAATALEAITR
jgi:hypothetical protein